MASHNMDLNPDGPVITWKGKSLNRPEPVIFKNMNGQKTSLDFRDRCNRLILGENKLVMAGLLHEGFREKVDLIYVDPPFGTGSDRTFTSGENQENVTQKAYGDKWGKHLEDYLQMMYECLWLMRELLAVDGSIYIHLDYHTSHYIKILLDELFGRSNLVNQVIWQRTGAHNDPRSFGRNYDIILFYQKSRQRKWNDPRIEYDDTHRKRYFRQDNNGNWYRLNNPTGKGYSDTERDFGRGRIKPPRDRHWSVTQAQIDKWITENRVVFTSNGYPFIKKYINEMPGRQVQSLWTDLIPPRSSSELTGYPTQKPEKLLKRIIETSSNSGDLVADFFCGSGTSLIVAEKLGRYWIGSDNQPAAIDISTRRLEAIPAVSPYQLMKAMKFNASP